MSDSGGDQPNLPLGPQGAATEAQTEELLKALLSAVMALGGRVDGLSDEYTSTSEALTASQSAARDAILKKQDASTEDLATQVGKYSVDMRNVLASLKQLQDHIDGGDYRRVMNADVQNHVGHLKEEVGFLSSALDSHIEKFGAINQEARKLIEAARSTQSEANRSLENAKDFVRGKTRIVALTLFIVVIISGWTGYLAAMKFETDTGTWAHQLKKAWAPTFLCSEMGFQVQRGTEGTSFCVSRINSER